MRVHSTSRTNHFLHEVNAVLCMKEAANLLWQQETSMTNFAVPPQLQACHKL